MIYDLEQKQKLVPLEDLASQEAELQGEQVRESLLRRLAHWLRCLASIPLIPFIAVCVLVKGLASIGQVVEQAEASARQQQLTHAFDFERIVIQDSCDETTGTVVFRMNYHALKGFGAAVKDLFAKEQARPKMSVVGLRGAKPVKPSDACWHAHSEFFFSPLPIEITVSLSDGLLRLREGVDLSASAEHWLRLAEAWLEVADRREPKLIVLDRFQSDWCDPQSTGRLMIEYLPDMKSEEHAAG